MKIIMGEEKSLVPLELRDDDNNIRGQGWHAERHSNRITLSFIRAEQGGRESTIEIDENDFELLRSDRDQFLTVVHRHGE